MDFDLRELIKVEGVFVLGVILSVLVLAVSVGIGIWARRLTRNIGDYFVAGRSIGALNNGLAMVSLGLSLTTFIGLTALIMELYYVAVAVYCAFTAAFIGLLVLAAPYLRQHKSFTTMAFISERYYSRNLRILSVVVMLVVSFIYLAGNIKGIGIVFEFLLDVPQFWGILVGGLIITLYVTFGGMYGVTYNQTFQTIVLLFCLMFPVAIILRELGAAGWFFPPLGYGGELINTMVDVNPVYFWPMSVHPGVYIAVFLGSFFGIIGLPHFVMRYFTVRDAKEARWSTVLCVFLIGLINLTVYATGFAAVTHLSQKGITVPAEAMDYMVFVLTESLAGSTWLAIAIAGSVAAGLSTVAGLLMIMGAGLVHDLYGSLNPDVPDEKKLKLSYAAMLICGIVVTIFSLNPPEFILKAIMWAFGIAAASLGVPIVLGIWWKRTTKEGAGAGMLFGFITTFICFIAVEVMGIKPVDLPIPFISKYLYDPGGFMKIMAFTVPLSFIITIVVSWFTKEPDDDVKRQVDSMHGWPDYEEKRYNGKGLPITIIILSIIVMVFMTLLYDTFA